MTPVGLTMEPPEIRYTTTSDGVRIAYGIYAGTGPPLMVLPATGALPMSMAHHIPGWDAYVEAICEGRTPVRLDFRATGYSNGDVTGLSLESHVADLKAAVAAIGEPLDIVADGAACTVVIAFAARLPGAVGRLLLSNPSFSGDAARTSHAMTEALYGTVSDLQFREVAMRQVFDIELEDVQALARLWAEAEPPAVFRAYAHAYRTTDVSELAPMVQAPTIVVANPPNLERSTAVAEALPCARLVVGSTSIVRCDAASGRWMRKLLDSIGTDTPLPSPPLEEPPEPAHLTPREAEILCAFAAGKSNAAIAEELGLSVRTVERHAQNIFAKVGANNRTEAAAWAIRNGHDRRTT